MPDAIRRNPSLLRELSTSDAQLAERALEQHEKRLSKILDAGARELENAQDDADRQLRNLVGKKDVPALRRALRDQHFAVRDLMQPPKGLGRDPSTLNAARRRKGEAMLKEFGISRGKLVKIGASFQQRVQKIAPPILGKVVPGFHTQSNIAQWMKLSPLHIAPLPWGVGPPIAQPGGPGQFALFRPPFFDWPDRFQRQQIDFGVTRTHDSDPFEGSVGHDVSIKGSGDPYGFASAVAETRLGLIFNVPADGQLEVIVDAENVTGTYDVRTTNEWGWSDVTARQTNSLSVHVLHPNVDPFLVEMSNLITIDESKTVHHESLIPGHHYFAHFPDLASPLRRTIRRHPRGPHQPRKLFLR